MSSILTNTGAMTALRVLRQTRGALDDTQTAISTGLSVQTSRDDAAVWAISKVMHSDARAFEQIGEGLTLGAATVAVGAQATETVADLMIMMKEKVIAGLQENVDRDKLTDDIDALREQIAQIVASAQFNGLNLVDRTYPMRGGGAELLASMDRGADGVAMRDIVVTKQDMSLHERTNDTWNSAAIGWTLAPDDRRLLGTVRDTESPGTLFRLNGFTGLPLPRPVVLGHGGDHEQTVRDLRDAMEYAAEVQGVPLTFEYETTATASRIYAINIGEADVVLDNVDLEFIRFGAPTEQTRVPGRLSLLNHVSVEDSTLARASLQVIERKLAYVVDAAAEFGTVANRIDTQLEFVSHLADALRSGIGALVDADLEEEGALQQALQAQTELAGQALAIANAAPQYLVRLFE